MGSEERNETDGMDETVEVDGIDETDLEDVEVREVDVETPPRDIPDPVMDKRRQLEERLEEQQLQRQIADYDYDFDD